jgi:MSHA biogenesis protein MshM
LFKSLNLALLDFARRKKRVVVCLDEAQAMPLDSLETLRLLTNLETEKRKLAQVILFGQPELDERLSHESVRQLRQRITFQHHLGSLTREETDHYLAHRLEVGGYSGDRVFAPAAIGTIYRTSRGVPRLVNILAPKALMLAYGEGSRKVNARHARAAAADTPSSFALSRAWLWLAIGCAAFSSIGWLILR